MTACGDAAAPAPQAAQAAATRLEEARAAWDQALAVIDEARKKQAKAPGLQEPAKKALATLNREWDGLAEHRDYPMISLDNNAAEVRHEVARCEWTRRKEGRRMAMSAA